METVRVMLKPLAQCVALLALVAGWSTAHAEPVTLKFAYFSSDRTITFAAAIKPFVDAVNRHSGGSVKIEIKTSGVLGSNPTEQLQLVLDGKADLAFIVPGYLPQRFRDNQVIGLPGLFRNEREATLTFTQLVAQGALGGYEGLFVVGAFATSPENIHLRPAVKSLEDLRGKRIRTNNPVQASALESLGMSTAQLPVNKAATALSRGDIDGATATPRALIEFGMARLAAHHYLLDIGAVSLAVVMKRETLEKLPPRAQEVIRKYGGEWTAERYISTASKFEGEALQELKSNPKRDVIVPSQNDRARAEVAFQTVREAWAAETPYHQELLAKAEAILAKIRSSQ